MSLEAMNWLECPSSSGNWDNSDFGRDLKARYSESPNVFLLDPIYDAGALFAVRVRASVYLHGHSAGGTNPLVEMMYFGVPVLAVVALLTATAPKTKRSISSPQQSLLNSCAIWTRGCRADRF